MSVIYQASKFINVNRMVLPPRDFWNNCYRGVIVTHLSELCKYIWVELFHSIAFYWSALTKPGEWVYLCVCVFVCVCICVFLCLGYWFCLFLRFCLIGFCIIDNVIFFCFKFFLLLINDLITYRLLRLITSVGLFIIFLECNTPIGPKRLTMSFHR